MASIKQRRYFSRKLTDMVATDRNIFGKLAGFAREFVNIFFFLYGAAAHFGPWPPLYEVP
jgi:hypothetical protein